MTTAYIGIGSNLGNRENNCQAAIHHLAAGGIKVLKRSSTVETEPWGVTDQPKFINMAVKIETSMEPVTLLAFLKKIENKMGRAPAVRWGPRVIDLDILFYDNIAVKTAELEIPHPWLQHRDFVLKPLAEIAPDMVHPVVGKSIRELLAALSRSNK